MHWRTWGPTHRGYPNRRKPHGPNQRQHPQNDVPQLICRTSILRCQLPGRTTARAIPDLSPTKTRWFDGSPDALRTYVIRSTRVAYSLEFPTISSASAAAVRMVHRTVEPRTAAFGMPIRRPEVRLRVDSCRPIPRGERSVSFTLLTFNQPHSTAPSWPVSNSGSPVAGRLCLCISARATSP